MDINGHVIFVHHRRSKKNKKSIGSILLESFQMLNMQSKLFTCDNLLPSSLSQDSRGSIHAGTAQNSRDRNEIISSASSRQSCKFKFQRPTTTSIQSERNKNRPVITGLSSFQEKIIEWANLLKFLKFQLDQIKEPESVSGNSENNGMRDNWVLIFELSSKIVVDFDKIKDIEKIYNFKAYWISAYLKKTLKAKVYNIVNEIFNYRNEHLRQKLSQSNIFSESIKQEYKANFQERPESEISRENDDLDSSRTYTVLKKYSNELASNFSKNETNGGVKNNRLSEGKNPLNERRSIDSFEQNVNRDDVVSSSVFDVDSCNYTAIKNIYCNKNYIECPSEYKFKQNEPVDSDLVAIVTVRDLIQGRKGRLAKILKVKLKSIKIKSYIMSVSHLLLQPQAVELMISLASSADDEGLKIAVQKVSEKETEQDVNIRKGCHMLIVKGLEFKLKNKKRGVIIVDLEDESCCKAWQIYDYCAKTLKIQTFAIERRVDGNCEFSLKATYLGLKKYFGNTENPEEKVRESGGESTSEDIAIENGTKRNVLSLTGISSIIKGKNLNPPPPKTVSDQILRNKKKLEKNFITQIFSEEKELQIAPKESNISKLSGRQSKEKAKNSNKDLLASVKFDEDKNKTYDVSKYLTPYSKPKEMKEIESNEALKSLQQSVYSKASMGMVVDGKKSSKTLKDMSSETSQWTIPQSEKFSTFTSSNSNSSIGESGSFSDSENLKEKVKNKKTEVVAAADVHKRISSKSLKKKKHSHSHPYKHNHSKNKITKSSSSSRSASVINVKSSTSNIKRPTTFTINNSNHNHPRRKPSKLIEIQKLETEKSYFVSQRKRRDKIKRRVATAKYASHGSIRSSSDSIQGVGWVGIPKKGEVQRKKGCFRSLKNKISVLVVSWKSKFSIFSRNKRRIRSSRLTLISSNYQN